MAARTSPRRPRAPAPAAVPAERSAERAAEGTGPESEAESSPAARVEAESGLARGVDALTGSLRLRAHLVAHVAARGPGLVEHEARFFASERYETEAAW